jgi:hypothetical protein
MKWVLVIVTVYTQTGSAPGLITTRVMAEGSSWHPTLAECQTWVAASPPAVVTGRTDQRVCVPILEAP